MSHVSDYGKADLLHKKFQEGRNNISLFTSVYIIADVELSTW